MILFDFFNWHNNQDVLFITSMFYSTGTPIPPFTLNFGPILWSFIWTLFVLFFSRIWMPDWRRWSTLPPACYLWRVTLMNQDVASVVLQLESWTTRTLTTRHSTSWATMMLDKVCFCPRIDFVGILPFQNLALLFMTIFKLQNNMHLRPDNSRRQQEIASMPLKCSSRKLHFLIGLPLLRTRCLGAIALSKTKHTDPTL